MYFGIACTCNVCESIVFGLFAMSLPTCVEQTLRLGGGWMMLFRTCLGVICWS